MKSYGDLAVLYYRLQHTELTLNQTFNMDRAEELVRDMEKEGIDALIDIYHTMMDGYTMIGNEEKCLIVFDR
uniref:Uncharacterized protein n=1 Tax=Solanum lycopersicum TaxID=4081 RepID=A0A3Q7FZN6_SOLLC